VYQLASLLSITFLTVPHSRKDLRPCRLPQIDYSPEPHLVAGNQYITELNNFNNRTVVITARQESREANSFASSLAS
jgi:hypothetical protein